MLVSSLIRDRSSYHVTCRTGLHPQSLPHFALEPPAQISQTLRSCYSNHMIAEECSTL
jgi:hypothetical protein